MLAYVLVGKSTRLPGKHTIEVLPGRRLIDIVLANLRSMGLDVVVYSKIPIEVDAPVIRDRTSWILESIISLFDYDDEFLLFGGDMPLVRGEAVDMLLKAREPGFSVVPRWRETGYLEPLHAHYSSTVRDCLRGARSLTTGLRECPWVKFISADDMPRESFFNVNTEEDMEKFRSIISPH